MKRIIYTAILLVSLVAGAAAQNQSDVTGISSETLSRFDTKLTGVVYHISALANSNFFLQEDWGTGSIELEDGVVYENVRMRYHALKDELVAYNDRLRILFIVDKETVKAFNIPTQSGTQHFVKLYFDGFEQGEKYFREIYTGAAKLLAFHFVDEVKVSPFTDKQGFLRDTEYRFAVHYYLYNKNIGFERLLKKRRSFLKIFPERKKEIRKLFRKNHLIMFDERGMVQAVQLLEEAGILK